MLCQIVRCQSRAFQVGRHHFVGLQARAYRCLSTRLNNIGIFSDLGCRSTNEDRFVVGHVGTYDLIGVFDGHSGPTAVDYVAGHVMPFAEDIINASSSSSQTDTSCVTNILSTLMHNLCDGLYAHMSETLEESKMHSGTTASIVLMDDTKIAFAHVGDSRILLGACSEPIQLNVDHRLENDDERARITHEGGKITYSGIPRVAGQLAMTRALGAFSLKNQGVICTPDIGVHAIKSNQDHALIVATDGLFDELRNDEVINIVTHHLSAKEAANALGDAALMYRARDNITIAVIPLPAWTSIHNNIEHSDVHGVHRRETIIGLDRNLVRRVS